MLRRTPLKAKTPIKRTAMKPTRRKAPGKAERRHLDRVAAIGCLVCGAPAEVHHVTSDGFARITRTHRRIVPLCPSHHRTGPDAVHMIGQGNFNAVHRLDILEWADREWERTLT